MKANIVKIVQASFVLVSFCIGILGYSPVGKTEEVKFTFLNKKDRTKIGGFVWTQYCNHYRGDFARLEYDAPRRFDSNLEKAEKIMESQNLSPDLISSNVDLYSAEIEYAITVSIVLLRLDEGGDREICREVLRR